VREKRKEKKVIRRAILTQREKGGEKRKKVGMDAFFNGFDSGAGGGRGGGGEKGRTVCAEYASTSSRSRRIRERGGKGDVPPGNKGKEKGEEFC